MKSRHLLLPVFTIALLTAAVPGAGAIAVTCLGSEATILGTDGPDDLTG